MNLNLEGMDRGTGQISMQEVGELRKALEAGYGTDVAQLQGGGSLRIQSLEPTLLATIQENRHFRLFNDLQKSNATATVDEWTEQRGIGGHLGGSTNSESGIINEANGDYLRRVESVKYLMTRRQVSMVVSIQNAIAQAEAVEYQAGALELLTDAEYLCFEGDAAVVPTEYNGILAQIKAYAPTDHVIDMRAAPLNSIAKINEASALISSYGNFGVPTDLYCSQNVQADFDTGLDPAFRVPLTDVPGGGIAIGSPVCGIRTSWGAIKNKPDVFVRDEMLLKAFEIMFPAKAAANTFASAGVAGVAAPNAASRFETAHAGNYFYRVAGVNSKGQSVTVASLQVAVASGDGVTLTIQPSVGGTETGYVIYRSKRNGTNAVADVREMIRVPKAAVGNTVYVDLNTDIPGTTKAYLLNLTPGHKSITWRQYLPMMKFPLYPTNAAVIPWAQLLFGYLRLGKVRHHVVFKNILPDNQEWRPF